MLYDVLIEVLVIEVGYLEIINDYGQFGQVELGVFFVGCNNFFFGNDYREFFWNYFVNVSQFMEKIIFGCYLIQCQVGYY